ncbi:MAG: hypothetical protein KDH96_00660 [Candidatus Riesia sp.]|nr:hypothetical protein [Candidatus Riesia sp.]
MKNSIHVFVFLMLVSVNCFSSISKEETPNTIYTRTFEKFGITTKGLIMVCKNSTSIDCEEYDTINNIFPLCSIITDIMIDGNINLVIDYYVSSYCSIIRKGE